MAGNVLDLVTAFADNAHGEQMRKYTPDRYIVHPVRVMKICKEYTEDEPILAAALLHDVLEDTPVTEGQIREFLIPLMGIEKTERTILLVAELTDIYVKPAYPGWNRKKRKQMERERIANISADAQTIKYADILDNCIEIVDHDRHFAAVFLRECMDLLTIMTKGNPVLYKRTRETLEKNLSLLKSKK